MRSEGNLLRDSGSVRNGNFGKHRLLTPIQKPMKSVSNTTDCGVLHRGLGSTNSSSH